MGFTSLFKTKDPTKLSPPPSPPPPPPCPPPPSWIWPSCKHPRTHSFRSFASPAQPPPTTAEALNKTSAFSGQEDGSDVVDISGLRSDRLFFDPGGETSSIVPPPNAAVSINEDAVEEIELESSDPCMDFRTSMGEMVAALGLRDFEGLTALLRWYLRVNVKANHLFILSAFVDLLMEMVFTGSACNSNVDTTVSCCSLSSSSSCSCSCSGFSSSPRIKLRDDGLKEGEEEGGEDVED